MMVPVMSNPPDNPTAPSVPAFLNYEPQHLRFGTSGLRGLVAHMTDLEVYINTRGFLAYLQQAGELSAGEAIAIAQDLRKTDPSSGLSSSPRIARAVAQAVRDAGNKVIHYGTIPTPALAYQALRSGLASVMVTGSHIPADRNGVKFYKKSGEVLKSDEAGILAAVAKVRRDEYGKTAQQSAFDERGMFRAATELEPSEPAAAQAFIERYANLGPTEAPLQDKHLVVYQHSAVGRDMLVSILESLGARVTPIERTDEFVPVDTEDVSAADDVRFKQWATRYEPDAIVSTDGDSDRPLVVDETGCFQRGDVLGIVTAEYLGARYGAVPISTSDALDRYARQWPDAAGQPLELTKTRIGSPYVIAAMQRAVDQGLNGVVGWEANGGFLTATDFTCVRTKLSALPTRDAMLPIVAVLLSAAERQLTVSQLFARLPSRATRAGLLDEFPTADAQAILARFSPADQSVLDLGFDGTNVSYQRAEPGAERPETAPEALKDEALALRSRLAQHFCPELGFGHIILINYLDGVRISFSNGDVAHLRPSGNAPQFRIYAVSDSRERADEIVNLALGEPDGLLRAMARDS